MSQASKSKITIGADPEVFVRTFKDKQFIPICGLVGGTKGAPVPMVPKSTYKWLEDGAALEFNFKPTPSYETFTNMCMEIQQMASKLMSDKGLEVVFASEADFRPGILEMFPEAMQIGCAPDFSAYDFIEGNTTPREKPDILEFGNKRFAAGHIHIGYTDKETVPREVAAMMFDAFVLLPTLRWDTQGGRRKFYGQAGLFRPKSYGIEHRSMSNWWFNPLHSAKLPVLAAHIISLFSSICNHPDEAATTFSKIDFDSIRDIVAKEDVSRAAELYLQICKESRLPGFMNYIATKYPFTPKKGLIA